LVGTIPNSVTNWIYIEYFYFAENQLIGTVPEDLGIVATNMKEFGISGNQITGTIPSTFGTYWSNLEEFLVSGNPLTGTIPMTISNWQLAKKIDFTGTNIIGTIPDELCNVTSVELYMAADADAVSCSCCDCCGF
jgi:hypothetical protein